MIRIKAAALDDLWSMDKTCLAKQGLYRGTQLKMTNMRMG
jgi:hypothetical protein